MATKTGKLTPRALPMNSVVKLQTVPICSEQFIADAKPQITNKCFSLTDIMLTWALAISSSKLALY